MKKIFVIFSIFTFALSAASSAAVVDVEEADKTLKQNADAVCILKGKKYNESKGTCAVKGSGEFFDNLSNVVQGGNNSGTNNLLGAIGGTVPGVNNFSLDNLINPGANNTGNNDEIIASQQNQNNVADNMLNANEIVNASPVIASGNDELVVAEDIPVQNSADEGAAACGFLTEEYVNREWGPKFTPNITCTDDRSEIVSDADGFVKIMHCTLADDGGQIRQMFSCKQNTVKVGHVILSNTPKQEKSVSEQMIGAVFTGQFDEAKNLITENPEIINYRDSSRGTAISIAARECNMDFINFLIDNGADVNGKGTYEYSAIREAAYYGCKDAVVKLKEKGARVDDTDAWGRGVCIQSKANQVRADIMKILGC